MPEKWTGEAIGRMHNNRITYEDVASEMGVTKAYVGQILNCVKTPEGAKDRINAAINSIISRRESIKVEQEG